jgi:hypothetical protein
MDVAQLLERQPSMSDIRDIIDRLNLIEGSATSAALPKSGLNAQQKSVPELPALFKPKNISPVLGSKKDPKHPTAGYFVGGESKDAYCAACDRVESQCICDSKDSSTAHPQNEDLLSKVKKGLNDYLKSVEDQLVGQDRQLINKAKANLQKDPLEKLLPVKTIRTDDGNEIKIHGNEDDGFRITVKGKPLKSKFDSLDEAAMACEMYLARRSAMAPVMPDQDYIEER